MATKRAQFSAISRDLNQIFFDFPFTVPEYFALITRALIVLEGIALTGDPDFDLFASAYPIAARHAAHIFGAAELARMLTELTTARSAMMDGATRPEAQPVRSAAGAQGRSAEEVTAEARLGTVARRGNSTTAALSRTRSGLRSPSL